MRPTCLCTGRDDVRCDQQHCDLASPLGAPGDSDRCLVCWQYWHSLPHNLAWGGEGRLLGQQPALPCRHLGPPTGSLSRCPTCPGSVRVKLHSCDLLGSCTTHKELLQTPCCRSCPHSQPIAPLADVSIRPPLPGRSFNGSICEWNGRTWLAYRRYWDRARIVLVELGHDWQPCGESKELSLGHLLQDRLAQEDPRLFVHRGQLHVSYTGCNWQLGQLAVSVCVARLGDDLCVEESYYPHLPERQPWEKNWGFFEYAGDLYAVHTLQPHRVMLVMLGQNKAWMCLEHDAHLPGAHYGALRGGTPPYLHNGEYCSFFHGKTEAGIYSVGLYTFAAKPPFAPQRFARLPLLWPTPSEKPAAHVADVVFPAGVILRDGCWHVSYGYYDQETRVASWRASDLEKLLEPVPA